MKKLPTLPPSFFDDDALLASRTNRAEAPRILPVDADLEIAEPRYFGSYGGECRTPFIVKDGRRQQVEPLPLAVD